MAQQQYYGGDGASGGALLSSPWRLCEEYVEYVADNVPICTERAIYVTDYMCRSNTIIAVGVDDKLQRCYMPLSRPPTMYLFVRNTPHAQRLLREITNVRAFNQNVLSHTVCEPVVPLHALSRNGLHTLLGSTVGHEPWIVLSCVVKSYQASQQLWRWVYNTPALHSWLVAPGQWSIEIMIAMMLAERTLIWNNVSVCIWIDADLNVILDKSEPRVPVVYFDIETTSSKTNHVPVGNEIGDMLVSVAFYRDDGGDAATASSAASFYLHIPREERPQEEVLSLSVPVDHRHVPVSVYFDERCMLRRVLQHMLDPLGNGGAFFLSGWNSGGYDLRFLLYRAVALRLDLPFHRQSMLAPMYLHHFHYGGTGQGLVYGFRGIHVDMMQYFTHFHKELNSYKLNNVASTLIKGAKKTDFDPSLTIPNLMREWTRCDDIGAAVDALAIKQLVEYNIRDTTLLLDLNRHLGIFDYLQQVARTQNLGLSRVCNYTTMEFLTGRIVLESLDWGNILIPHHKNTFFYHTPSAIEYRNDVPAMLGVNPLMRTRTDAIVVTGDTAPATGGSDRNEKYSGGFNFCRHKCISRNVAMGDFATAYPNVIADANVSFETVSLVSTRVLLDMIPLLDPAVLSKADLYLYNRHKRSPDASRTENIRKYQQSLDELGLIDSHLVNTVRSSLATFATHPLVVAENRQNLVWVLVVDAGVKMGALSVIQKRINQYRADTKRESKQLKKRLKQLSKKDTTADPVGEVGPKQEEKTKKKNKNKREAEDAAAQGPKKKNKKQCVSSDTRVFTPVASYMLDITGRKVTATPEDANEDVMRGIQLKLHGENRTYKMLAAAVYGCLGSRYGLLATPELAPSVTFLVRSALISVATQCQKELGGTCVFIDTDSVFVEITTDKAATAAAATSEPDQIVAKVETAIASYLQREWPYHKMGFKLYRNAFFLGKKTYFFTDADGKMDSRGMTKNGPALWREILLDTFSTMLLIDAEGCPDNVRNAHDIWSSIYKTLYARFKADPTSIVFMQRIRRLEDYAGKNSPVQKMIRAYPHISNLTTVPTYYHLSGSVHNIDMRPFDASRPPHIRDVNMYKFVEEVNKVLTDMIQYVLHVIGNPQSFATIQGDNEAAFVLARLSTDGVSY